MGVTNYLLSGMILQVGPLPPKKNTAQMTIPDVGTFDNGAYQTDLISLD